MTGMERAASLHVRHMYENNAYLPGSCDRFEHVLVMGLGRHEQTYLRRLRNNNEPISTESDPEK